MKYIRSAQEEIISNGDIHIRPLLRNTGWYDLLDDDEVRGTELTVARRAGDPLCWTIPNDVSREIFTGAPFNYFVLFAGNTYSPPDIKNAPSNRDHGCTSFGRIKLDNCSHQCEWFPWRFPWKISWSRQYQGQSNLFFLFVSVCEIVPHQVSYISMRFTMPLHTAIATQKIPSLPRTAGILRILDKRKSEQNKSVQSKIRATRRPLTLVLRLSAPEIDLVSGHVPTTWGGVKLARIPFLEMSQMR